MRPWSDGERILRHQIMGRMRLTDGERKTLAAIGQKLGKQALKDVATIVTPDTIPLPLFSPHLCYAAIYSMEVSVFSDREIFCVSRGNAGDVAVVNCLFAPMCRGGQTPPFPQPRRLSGVAVVTVCHA